VRPRRKLTWLVFAICILAVVEGLGWVTWHALRLEKAEREARAAAAFQESIRLALWRMESEITPIIAAESARPYFHYMSFYPAERAYTRMWQQVKPNEVRVPSPLLESSGPYIHLHFQIDSSGKISSPQVPTGNERDLAEGHQYVDAEFIILAEQMLGDLTAIIEQPTKTRSVDYAAGKAVSAAPPPPPAAPQLAAAVQPLSQPALQQQAQSGLDQAEYNARVKAAETAQTLNMQQPDRRQSRSGAPDRKLAYKSEEKPAEPAPASDVEVAHKPAEPSDSAAKSSPTGEQSIAGAVNKEDDEARWASKKDSLVKEYQQAGPATEEIKVDQGPFTPLWRPNPKTGASELILKRSVVVEGAETTQGIWIDWPLLRERLLGTIKDLLPQGTLSPALDSSTEEAGQRLASIPVRLLPGQIPSVPATLLTPTHITLAVTWAAILGAISAIAIVLRTAMELSERRGRFVSAVTHELRTPLTTFCIYTEMLSGGMVKDENARQQYLKTLQNESGRLARIVQNVLDYAGIGGLGKRTPGPAAPILVADLVEKLKPSLETCAARAGMQLIIEHENLDGYLVRADPQTIERILLNLVENAGKYAGDASDKRIHIEVRQSPGSDSKVSLSVRDHGPGVPREERRRVFQAFQRATRDAHGPKSGLGLGLALARELARELDGRLELSSPPSCGAEFVLILPATIHTKT
jgi:signal transduction histidine kinase